MDVLTCRADTPERICHVSRSGLALVRYPGHLTYNGWLYWYLAAEDMLIRDDVRKRNPPGFRPGF